MTTAMRFAILKILYLGRNSGTSQQRKEALLRLGHEVLLIDPHAVLPSNRASHLWQWHTGALGVAEIVRRRLIRQTDSSNLSFDLAWIDQGSLISPGCVEDLKARIPRVLCYTIDDPFGGRDKRRWRQFFRALSRYDLLVVVRSCNVREAHDRGARNVLRVFMSADEVAHAPRQLAESQVERWRSEVVFVGTAFPERGPFLAELVRLGVPLAIYGNRYERLAEWPLLRPYWRPTSADSAEAYAAAISAAKVCLGLLSKENRDQHTTRSMEIPSLGGLLCAERSPEHLALYEEDREAIFWNSPQECAAQCMALLADAPRREAIAAAGRMRYLQNPWRNESVADAILCASTSSSGAHSSSVLVFEAGATLEKLTLEARTGPPDIYVDSPSTR